MTAFILAKDMAGFASGKPEYKMGIKGSNTVDLSFQDVVIPSANVIDAFERCP